MGAKRRARQCPCEPDWEKVIALRDVLADTLRGLGAGVVNVIDAEGVYWSCRPLYRMSNRDGQDRIMRLAPECVE